MPTCSKYVFQVINAHTSSHRHISSNERKGRSYPIVSAHIACSCVFKLQRKSALVNELDLLKASHGTELNIRITQCQRVVRQPLRPPASGDVHRKDFVVSEPVNVRTFAHNCADVRGRSAP